MESISYIPDSKILVFLEYPEPLNPKELSAFLSALSYITYSIHGPKTSRYLILTRYFEVDISLATKG